jgi:hypothetical protein
MATAIPDLWSDDIRVDVVPPLAVLRAQEGLLAKKTQGILQAQILTSATETLVQHSLYLIAPALNFYRVNLLSATHDREMVYPVTVTAQCWFDEFLPDQGQQIEKRRVAATEEEFIDLVRQALRSPEVRGLIQSLIARSNEIREGQAHSDSTKDGNGPPAEGEQKSTDGQ